MDDRDLPAILLDNWSKPVVFVDGDHIIRYMNRPAERHYSKWGNVIGKSIFECHNEHSCRVIRETYEKLKGGTREVLITDSEKHRVYMRSVRDRDGKVVGYFERYDPPGRGA